MTPEGAFVEIPIPTAGAQPARIAAAPDGNLGFAEFAGNKIGRVNAAIP